MKNTSHNLQVVQNAKWKGLPSIVASRAAKPFLDLDVIKTAIQNHRSLDSLPYCFHGKGNTKVMIATTEANYCTFFFLPREWDQFARKNDFRQLTAETATAA